MEISKTSKDSSVCSDVENSLWDSASALKSFIESDCPRALAEMSEAVANAILNGNKVIIAGNGGSMADAMHFAEELTGRYRKDRRPLPAIALSDPTHLTCVANDYGYRFVFSRLVEAYGNSGDVVILLSTSGNSENLIEAARSAHLCKALVMGFLGRGGGELAAECDWRIVAPGQTSDRIQEIHMLCLHIMVEMIEKVLGLD